MALLRILLFFSLMAAWSAGAEDSGPSEPERLPLSSLITEVPRTSWNTLKFAFQRDSVPAWTGIIISTALLYQYDGDIYAGAQKNGRDWGIGNEDRTKTVMKMGPYPILRLPSDTGSTLYFLGDGWTHFGTSAAFFLYGQLSESNRAFNTGLQIFHGMIVSTFFNQALKRGTGRESPSDRTVERGVWRPFPSVRAYSSNTPKYDAFPSGHVMTATLTFETIRMNYPEYSSYILPLEVLWLTALSWQMVNNGVHWASDYPLAVAMGWAVAKMSVQMGRPDADKQVASSWTILPSFSELGPQMNLVYAF
ncbi:MAG: phosphatase PAP2 family protein [Calothrix sp. SM1_5_4]|nr:phosphatase PAP2 family protein [Calothrix sp. SM1_5_4]